MPSYMPVSQRWAERAPTGAAEECWEWPGSVTFNGYGRIWDGDAGRYRFTHRYAYEAAFGPIPEGDVCVCHRCDNRLCVNPGHLFLGSRADNLADMRKKNRGAKGDSHGRRKLTSDQVVEIRARRAAGESRPSVARAFGVCNETVSLITNRHIWTEVV